MYRIRRTTDEEAVKALHTLIFPSDEWERADAYWIVWDSSDTAVGFCGAKVSRGSNSVYLIRAGLFANVRGGGLQKRMITIREKWGRAQGLKHSITYTVYHNHPSIASLLKCGYRLYHPQWAWAGDGVHYFIKDL